MSKNIQVDDANWLEFRLLQAKTEPFAVIKKITPFLAQQILNKNPDNRNVKSRHVITIASDLENGKWELNGEAIVIASDGSLNDGQHRLHACILAGVPFETVVVFGVKRSSRFTVDIGTVRTGGDFLFMQKVSYGNNKAALARLLVCIERGMYITAGAGNNLSKPEILSFYEANKTAIDEAVQFVLAGEIPSTHKLPVSGAYYLLKINNPTASEVFFQKLKTGALLSYGDPILKLREHLFDPNNTRLLAYEKLELILRYWNAWRRGDKLSRRLAVMGHYPEILK